MQDKSLIKQVVQDNGNSGLVPIDTTPNHPYITYLNI